MTENNTNRKSKREAARWILLVIVLLILFFSYARTIYLSKCTVPYGDFITWTMSFSEMYEQGNVDFLDFFSTDSGAHMQPMAMFIYYIILKHSCFDYSRIVELGIVASFILLILVETAFCLQAYRQNNKKFDIAIFISALCLCLIVLNLNQWEMLEFPFGPLCEIRVGLFLISFHMVYVLIKGANERSTKNNIILCIFLGIFICAVTILIAAGYFVAYITAIGTAGLIAFFKSYNRKKLTPPLLVMTGILTACVVIYVYFALSNGKEISSRTIVSIYDLLRGLVLFWGASVFHICLVYEYGLLPAYIIGVVLILLTAFSCIRFFKNRNSNLIPIMLLVYANVAAITIGYARIPTYGVSTMTSSRYVVESSIGLIGLIIVLYTNFKDNKEIKFQKIFYYLSISFLCIMLILSAKVEMNRTPSVKDYFDNIREIQMDYNNRTDEELSRVSGDYVGLCRECLEFLDKNDLSIFSEKAEQKDFISYVLGGA